MLNRTSPLVIFQHIPKTAGTSLRHALQQQFRPQEVFEFYKLGHDYQKSIEKFKDFYGQRSDSLKLISSHLGFGLHNYIEAPVSYITVLREPTKRIISYYHHLVKLNHPEAVGRSLKEFVQNFGGVQNGMTCNLSGVTLRAQIQDPTLDLEAERNSEETLALASNNLKEHFNVVGLLEHFDESCLLLNQHLGWELPIGAINSNVGKKRKTYADISPETFQVIEEYNQLDIQLYEQAKSQFQLEIKNLDYDINQKLEQLKSQKQTAWDQSWNKVRVFSNRLSHSLYQKLFVSGAFSS